METLGCAAAVGCGPSCSHAVGEERGVPPPQPPLILLRDVSAAPTVMGAGPVRSHVGDSAPGVPFAATPGVRDGGQGAPAGVSRQPCAVRGGGAQPWHEQQEESPAQRRGTC